MRKLKEILRLKYSEKLTHREIAQAVGVSIGTVGSVSVRAQALKLTAWTAIADFDEEALEVKFYGVRKPKGRRAPLPDPLHIHHELKRFCTASKSKECLAPKDLQYRNGVEWLLAEDS